MPDTYKKRVQVRERDQIGFIYYTDIAKKILQKINDSQLLEFGCGDGIIRTVQGAYMLESEKTSLGEKRRVQNEKFIEFMRSKEPALPPGKRILSARVCELQDKAILLFYTTGSYDPGAADYQTPRLVVLNSSDNSAFVEVIKKGLFVKTDSILKIRESKDHTRCDNPFQIGKDRSLYILCEEKKDLVSIYYVYRINLNNGASSILETCINKFENGLETICN